MHPICIGIQASFFLSVEVGAAAAFPGARLTDADACVGSQEIPDHVRAKDDARGV